jgi:Flp pilus assembly protein TadG
VIASQRTTRSRSVAGAWRLLRLFANADGIGTKGTAAIEFGMIVPVLALLFVCTIDLGMGFYRKMQAQNAAQAGAEYAAIYGYNPSSISSAITNATSFSVTASPSPTQFCACPTSSGVTNATCGATCSDGSTAATYVTASALGTYSPILQYPMIPSSFTFQAQSTVRIQ